MIWWIIVSTIVSIPLIAGLYWLFSTFGWLAAIGLYFGIKPKKEKPVETDKDRALRDMRGCVLFLAISAIFLIGLIIGVEIGS